ncbi:hypothetical protein TIFTF001_028855 [Ficus carica]|uniref:Uncharacterized protein n=1 Tax=Ficus carica TaxID=3494 RepID=A0AA88DQJ0_FICCA|nr:hypothetical protein TIFTF001_028855 [Ficus carica]
MNFPRLLRKTVVENRDSTTVKDWILAVIDPWDDSVMYFNPLGNEPGDDFKDLITMHLMIGNCWWEAESDSDATGRRRLIPFDVQYRKVM